MSILKTHTRAVSLAIGAAVAAVTGLLLVAIFGSAGVAPAGPNPPGNNGTIKLDDVVFDDHPNNEPHVGCTFQVDFYGFDEGELFADVTFEAHPPTGPVVVLLTDSVFIGEDDNSGGGSESGLDAVRDVHARPVGHRAAPRPGLAREADDQRRRLAGCRREAQGLLGQRLRLTADDVDDVHDRAAHERAAHDRATHDVDDREADHHDDPPDHHDDVPDHDDDGEALPLSSCVVRREP